MNVLAVSGARSPESMGLELAEQHLLAALRRRAGTTRIHVGVVGRRNARRHARRLGASWIPSRKSSLPRSIERRVELVHLLGLDLRPPRHKPFVAMIHDLAPLRYDDEGSLPSWTRAIVDGARMLLTPSAFTAAELQHFFDVSPSRVRVVGGAPVLDARHSNPLSAFELADLGITQPFVIRYGGYTKRKNVSLLLDAWPHVKTGTLVLAGPAQFARAQILSRAPALGRVVVLDYISQKLLARLLRSAAALVSTSLYEGFGLPPLEAMSVGIPVIAVSTSFSEEMCGGGALLVEPNPTALADALQAVLTDSTLSGTLARSGPRRAATFSWNKAADAVLAAYFAALGASAALATDVQR